MKYFNFFIILTTIAVLFVGCVNVPANNTSSIFGSEDVNMTPRLIDGNNLNSSVEVVKNAAAAVVGINSVSGTSSSVGSGVAIAKNGYVLTNSHVITNPYSITLYLADGTTSNASLIWRDSSLDLAVLKSSKELPYLKLAEDDDINVGEDVLAIGTPFQLQFKHSVTKGIVSALNRTVLVSGTYGDSYLQSLIQHDASINPGNSGGPLINGNAEVLGINTVKIESGEGMGFAIPTSVTRNVIKNVITDGSYTSAYLGVFGYDSAIPNYYGKTDRASGFYVLGVKEDSPASLAGIKPGNVITKINDKRINTRLKFIEELYKYKENDKIKLTYYDTKHKKTVELGLTKKQIKELEKAQ